MRRTVSCRVSPAPLRVRTPGVPRVGPSRPRRNERRTREAEVEAAAPEASYRGGVRGKTRPDSSRRLTGHNLTLEKNVVKVKRKVISLAFPPHRSFSLTSPRAHPPRNSRLPASPPTIISKATGPRMGSGLVCERCSGDVMERRQQQEARRQYLLGVLAAG